MDLKHRPGAHWLIQLGSGLIAIGMALPSGAQQPAVQPAVPPSFFESPATRDVVQPPKAPVESFKNRLPNGDVLQPKRITIYSSNVQPPKQVPNMLENGTGNRNADVHEGQRVILPFGSKGEHVALAFHTGDFVPPVTERIQPALASLAQYRAATYGGIAAGAVTPSVYGIILLNGRFDDGTKAALQDLGVEVEGFYPYSAVLARIPTTALNAVAGLKTVRWIGQPNAAQKIHSDIAKKLLANTTTANTKFHVWVSFFASDKDGHMRADLQAAGMQTGFYDDKIAVQEVYATPAQIQLMTQMDHVLYLEPINTAHTMNEIGAQNANADWLWGGWDPNGTATQVKVGLLDTGIYVYHTDFSNILNGYDGGTLGYSLISGESWYNDLNGHGTHVSGTIIGEGNGNFRYRGIADRLTTHHDVNNPDYLVAQVLDQTGHGSYTTIVQGMGLLDTDSGIAGYKRQLWNCSIGGNDGAAENTTDCRKVDSSFGDNILCCIAAGNSGPNANTVGTPGAAKGALTVGAVYNNDEAGVTTDSITSYSSRGPTGGGHYKPDIVSPGSFVDSVKTQTSSDYALDWEGTSMATPHVTGIAAGFLSHYGVPAWVAKAVLCASAIDLGYARNTQGLGKVDAMMAHWSIDGGVNWWWNTVGSTGSTQYVDFTINHTVAQLKIVMTYPDPPCAAGASTVLVNDLDLYVQSSALGNLTTDLGYNWRDFSTEPVSVVTLNNAPAATYRIKVNNYSGSAQAWGLAVKVVDSALYPTLHTALTVPYAIQPGNGFYANATAYPDAHSATGIRGSISLPSGVQIDGALRHRHGPGGDETIWMATPGGPAYYEMNHFDMGAAPQWYTRETDWWLEGTTEGNKAITFNAGAVNAFGSSSTAHVIVDGTSATIGVAEGRHWTFANHCDVYAPAQDTLSGLNPATAWYRYSTNNGSTWSSWVNTTCSGAYGSTAVETITCPDVPFNQNNANNLIQLFIADAAGNVTYSSNMVITTPALKALTLTPTTIAGGNSGTGKVTLAAAAPTDGAVVALATTNPAASVPASVTVPAGATTATFTISTSGVSVIKSGTVTAKYAGVTKSVTLKVRPPYVSAITFAPNKVTGGYQNSTGTVKLDAVATVNTTVNLTSDNAAITVPATATVLAGSNTVTFPATSHAVTAVTAVHVSGAANGGAAKTGTITVNPVTIASLKLSTTSTVGGTAVTGFVTLNYNAAPGDIVVNLSSSNTAVAAPAVASITIPAGTKTGSFTINTSSVAASTTVTIKAQATTTTKSANLTVKP